MRASRSSLLALLAALGAAGCSREIDSNPFDLRLNDESGLSLLSHFDAPGLIGISGLASRTGDTTLSVKTTDGTMPTVVFVFDNSAARAVVFPAALDGQQITALVLVDPGGKGPRGALPFPALRISVGGHARFMMAEGAYVTDKGEPAVPPPLQEQPTDPVGELPGLSVLVTGLYVEPSRCGDLYYDLLHTAGSEKMTNLDFGERAVIAVLAPPDLGPWTVFHVRSYHRAGVGVQGGQKVPKDCAQEGNSWTQLAAWR